MTITLNQLAAEIRNLSETTPITAEFERVLIKRGVWNTNGVWYTSQKEHWLGWLKGYNGPGHYRRKHLSPISRICVQPHRLPAYGAIP